MRKRVKRNTRYWVDLDTASKCVGKSSEWLYMLYKRGALLPVFPLDSSYALGVTWNELNYLYPGTQSNTARRRVTSDELFIGYAFKTLAKHLGAEWFRSLEDIPRHDKWFDGTVYMADSALYRVSFKTLEFVCSRIFQYNALIKRYRPDRRSRKLIFCADTRKKRALKLQARLNALYPDVVSIVPISQVFKVKYANDISKTAIQEHNSHHQERVL